MTSPTTAYVRFEVDPRQEGQGTLIVADASVLLRPAPPRQFQLAEHDTEYAYSILSLGDRMGIYQMHIFCKTSVRQAFKMLDGVFDAYIKIQNMRFQHNAVVVFHDSEGNVIEQAGYGYEGGKYTTTVSVYCDIVNVELAKAMVMQRIDPNSPFILVGDGGVQGGFKAVGMKPVNVIDV
jgi:hypothetical protein